MWVLARSVDLGGVWTLSGTAVAVEDASGTRSDRPKSCRGSGRRSTGDPARGPSSAFVGSTSASMTIPPLWTRSTQAIG